MPTGHALPYVPPSPLRIANRNNRAPRRAASPSPAPESARQAPPKGNFSRQSCRLSIQAGGFPRGKQSARRALPCVPLVVCLNSGSLTAFGGCIHWIPASLRSPLHPFGSPTETIERLIGLQVLLPRRSRRVKPRQGEFLRQSCRLLLQAGGLSARPPAPPSGRTRRAEQGVCACGRTGGFPLAPSPLRAPLEAIERPIGLQALSLHRLRRATHHQSKTAPGRRSLPRRGPLGCFVIPSPRPPSRRTRCISGMPDRKPRWAGSPASAWPSLRPCPPSRSRPSGTVRQWGWSCIS